MLHSMGVRNLIAFDRSGPIYQGRVEHMNPITRWFAEQTNPARFKGSIEEAVKRADVFIGLSGPGVIRTEALRNMARDAIVFALANPTPEVRPEDVSSFARIIATGRSDYANQINNALAYPGVFRGALDVRARAINDAMKLAAARALAGIVRPSELHEDYIVPSVFNPRVVPIVAAAVADAARQTHMARRTARRTAADYGGQPVWKQAIKGNGATHATTAE
jgi:malate dehydrogenase (oxaloacetate-decarboxylating)